MCKVIDQIKAGEYAVLFLDAALPVRPFFKIKIADKLFLAEIVYDMEKCIAIAAEGEFVGKTIEFI